MANNESEVERKAGIDMVPLGESYEWKLGPDDDTILRHEQSSQWSRESGINVNLGR